MDIEILLDVKGEGAPIVPHRYIRAVRESGGLGDVIRCLSVLQGLRLKYPDCRLHFYGPGYLSHLLVPRTDVFDCYMRCDNQVRPRDALIDEERYPHLARNIDYEESIDMFCPAYMEEPETAGIVCQERTELWCQDANVTLTRPKLFPTSQDLKVRDNMLKRHKRIVGFQVGATCRSREWPYKYWGKLAKLLKKDDVHVIIFDVCYRWGSEIDVSDAEMVVNGSWYDVVGKILSTDLMVTPDSGFYHLCGALNKRTLGIFGPTSGSVISRIWNIGEPTHSYLQTDWDEVDPEILPKSNGEGRPCKAICYQRWERGWDSTRYRKENKHCVLIEQITPETVHHHIMSMINDPYDNQKGLSSVYEKYEHRFGYPLSMKKKITKWTRLASNIDRQQEVKDREGDVKT